MSSHVAAHRPSCARRVLRLNAKNIARFVQILVGASCYPLAPGFALDLYGGKWFRASSQWDGQQFVAQRLQWPVARRDPRGQRAWAQVFARQRKHRSGKGRLDLHGMLKRLDYYWVERPEKR